MSLHGWITLAVVAACFLLMLLTHIGPELILLGGVVVLFTTGVISSEQALAGFSNEGMITVALMYVVVAGIRETGGIDLLVQHVLGRPRHVRGALLRLMPPVASISAIMNNTPLVAIFLPAVLSWAKRMRISPSKLLIPLSYAAVMGGTISMIGTSTNLIVNGLLAQHGRPTLGLFDIAWVGIPCTLAGLLYLLWLGPKLLPARIAASETFENPKEYTVEMEVEAGGPLVGKTVEEAALRHLQGLYLVEIERGQDVLAAVGPYEHLLAGDRLVFAGVTDSVVDLQRIRGLRPSADNLFKRNGNRRTGRVLVEAVVAPNSAVVGKTLRESRFRMVYGGSVIAIARNGARLKGKLGEIRLEASDTLLIDARPPFIERNRNSSDFLLISQVSDYLPVRHNKAWIAWTILGMVVLAATMEWLSMINAALLGAMAVLVTGCSSAVNARKSLDATVLLAIAASFGLGNALQESGAAAIIARTALGHADGDPWLILVLVYLLATVLTEILSNNAVAVLMFPLVTAIAEQGGLNPMPFVVALMVAASMAFATPIGYQTNLMVYGPGGYRFGDFVRLGLPLNLLLGALALLIIPQVWPFH